MKPIDVNQENAKILKNNIYLRQNNTNDKRKKFKVNENVRISKYKHVFEKGYIPNWTNEIFIIEKIN